MEGPAGCQLHFMIKILYWRLFGFLIFALTRSKDFLLPVGEKSRPMF